MRICTRWLSTLFAGWFGGLNACANHIPLPPLTSHAGLEPIAIESPPPTPRAEVVPPPPSPWSVWVDGEWERRLGRWSWKHGRWETPTPGARYAPATVVRLQTGELRYFPGVWRYAAMPSPPP